MQHLRNCSECRVELERFETAVKEFRSAIRHRIDGHVAVHASLPRPLRPAAAGVSTWRWAMIATAIVALVIPFFMSPHEPQDTPEQASFTGSSPDMIMDAVNRHLSRRLPAPMEPIMSLIPTEEWTTQLGGVQ
jgi:hypothetical protein